MNVINAAVKIKKIYPQFLELLYPNVIQVNVNQEAKKMGSVAE